MAAVRKNVPVTPNACKCIIGNALEAFIPNALCIVTALGKPRADIRMQILVKLESNHAALPGVGSTRSRVSSAAYRSAARTSSGAMRYAFAISSALSPAATLSTIVETNTRVPFTHALP